MTLVRNSNHGSLNVIDFKCILSGVISIHGTSTKANDKNESHVYNDIFKSLERTPGNAVPVIAQKNLTGHPKGGAAAWMLIGLCQSIASGIIPGNRNAE